MPNNDIDAAWRFHNSTKYVLSPSSEILMGELPSAGPALGEQSPDNEPQPFKVYPGIPAIPLPRESRGGTMPALDAIASSGEQPAASAIPDLAALAHFCLRSNGILKQWRGQWGKEIYFRAAGCTGARYHLELYLVCGQLPDLDAGVYHYSARDHALGLIRAGDLRGNVVEATGNEPAVSRAPVIAMCTSTFWRNAWRYQERSYRHVFWDTGTLFANMLAVAADLQMPAAVVLGYHDDAVNSLIDVDGEHEAAVALFTIGRGGDPAPSPKSVESLDLATEPISASEIDFPGIRAMHRASALESGDDATRWRDHRVEPIHAGAAGQLFPLLPLPNGDLPTESIEQVILRRRSNRHYDAGKPLSFALLSTVLQQATRGTAMDCLGSASSPLHDVYLIVNNVDGLVPGSYVLGRDRRSLELLSAGDQRTAAARLACGQAYAADAQVNVYLLTDLHPILARYGNRGYRLAQLDAALAGGRIQLAAHALGLGAVGSTSDDDAVIDHFSPHARDKSFMFVAVFGHKRAANQQENLESTAFLRG